LPGAPYGILPSPLSNFTFFDQALGEYKRLASTAEEAITLCEKAQSSLASQKYAEAYQAFQGLRSSLESLGDTSLFPWIDKNLRDLEPKIPPELAKKYRSVSFPWWGWLLIGCGAAGILGLGGWFLWRKKRARQKAKGQQL